VLAAGFVVAHGTGDMQGFHRAPGFTGIDALGDLATLEIIIAYLVISRRVLVTDQIGRQESVAFGIQHAETLSTTIGGTGRIDRHANHEFMFLVIPVELDGSTVRLLVDASVCDHSGGGAFNHPRSYISDVCSAIGVELCTIFIDHAQIATVIRSKSCEATVSISCRFYQHDMHCGIRCTGTRIPMKSTGTGDNCANRI